MKNFFINPGLWSSFNKNLTKGSLDLGKFVRTRLQNQSVISADTTFTTSTLPLENVSYYITKSTAATIVLPNPISGTQDGLRLTFTGATAAAHTITYSGGFDGTDSTYDTATFNSNDAAGSGHPVKGSITIEAYQGIWYLVSDVNVTIS